MARTKRDGPRNPDYVKEKNKRKQKKSSRSNEKKILKNKMKR